MIDVNYRYKGTLFYQNYQIFIEKKAETYFFNISKSCYSKYFPYLCSMVSS